MRLDDKSVSYAVFKLIHEKNFSILLPTIQTFAQKYSFEVAHSFDRDPLGPHACYFCLWRGEKRPYCFIRICVQDPFEPDSSFYVDAEGKQFFHQRWIYSSESGLDTLRSILDEARRILEEQSE